MAGQNIKNIKTAKSELSDIMSRAKESAIKTLSENGIDTKKSNRKEKERSKPVSQSVIKYPDQKGVFPELKAVVDYFKKNPILKSELPKEISVSQFHNALYQAIKELDGKEGATTSGLLGRIWEILGIEFPEVKSINGEVLDASIGMLQFLVEKFP